MGVDPQQARSDGPGLFMGAFPVNVLGALKFLLTLALPQAGQRQGASCPRVMHSPVRPQSRQVMSKMGMEPPWLRVRGYPAWPPPQVNSVLKRWRPSTRNADTAWPTVGAPPPK